MIEIEIGNQVSETVKLEVNRMRAVMVCKRQTLTTKSQCALVLHIFSGTQFHHIKELETTTFEKWTGDNLPWLLRRCKYSPEIKVLYCIKRVYGLMDF